MRLRVGSTTITVERGDITDRDVDAIVNAANTTLAMGAGVAGAIKRKGGLLIEEEAMQQGPIEVGAAVLTDAGNLRARHIIHAAVMGPDGATNATAIGRASAAALTLAEKQRMASVALPALGTGVGGVPAAVSAEAMAGALAIHLKPGTSSLEQVAFVLLQDDMVKAFSVALRRVAGGA